jgi:hypothetical protein
MSAISNLCAQGGNDPHLFALAGTEEWAVGLPAGTWTKSWPKPPPVPLKEMAAQDGPDPHLFGLDINNDLWAIGLPEGRWVKNWPSQPPVPLVQIGAQSGSDAHLFGLDANRNLWAIGLPGGRWVKNWPSSPPAPLVRIAAQGGDDPHLFGLSADNRLFAIGLPSGVWVENWPHQPPARLVALAAQNPPDPHLFGLDANGDQWAIGLPSGVWVKGWPKQPPVPLAKLTAQAGNDAHLFALDRDNNFYAVGLPRGDWVKNWPKPLATAGLTEQQLRTAIATYGPVLRFHPAEPYNMCSVEAFLAHSKLHDKQTGVEINHPSVAQLPSGGGGDGRYWLILEDGFKQGDLSTAKAYVHAYWKPGLSYTDLQFWFFYAYNGPGTAHVNGLVFDTIAHTGDVNMAPMGEHYGDWECCMVRIDNDSKQMIGAWLSQHSGGEFFQQPDLQQFQKVNVNQIVVYASRNGHAVYAHAGANYTEHYKFPPGGIPAGIEFFLRNDTADGGRSLDCARNYQIVSADWLGVALPEPNWVNYMYRWGPEGTTSHLTPQAVIGILEAGLGWLAALVPGSILTLLAVTLLPIFVKDDLNGPGAPKGKGTWTGDY